MRDAFCVFNDAGVAVQTLKATGELERALIVDCAAHQGDGTADLFAGDPAAFTFSIHSEKNYPVRKVASDLDTGLPDDTGDTAYLEALSGVLENLIAQHHPDIVVFNSGVDPHRDDDLGRLSLSDQGLRERERRVSSALPATTMFPSPAWSVAAIPRISRRWRVATRASTGSQPSSFGRFSRRQSTVRCSRPDWSRCSRQNARARTSAIPDRRSRW